MVVGRTQRLVLDPEAATKDIHSKTKQSSEGSRTVPPSTDRETLTEEQQRAQAGIRLLAELVRTKYVVDDNQKQDTSGSTTDGSPTLVRLGDMSLLAPDPGTGTQHSARADDRDLHKTSCATKSGLAAKDIPGGPMPSLEPVLASAFQKSSRAGGVMARPRRHKQP